MFKELFGSFSEVKLLLIFTAIGWMAPVIAYLDAFWLKDGHFIISLSIAVSIDMVLGVWAALRQKRLSSKKLGRFVPKALVYCLLLLAVHATTQYEVDGKTNILLAWLDSLVFAAIMVRELLSIIEKLGMLGFRLLPKWIMAHLENFNEHGRFAPTSGGLVESNISIPEPPTQPKPSEDAERKN